MTWYPCVNDLIGGWCVTNVDSPDGLGSVIARRLGVIVIADMMTRADAYLIADLLNQNGVER